MSALESGVKEAHYLAVVSFSPSLSLSASAGADCGGAHLGKIAEGKGVTAADRKQEDDEVWRGRYGEGGERAAQINKWVMFYLADIEVVSSRSAH